MNPSKIRIEVGVALDLQGAEIIDIVEIDRAEWDGLSAAQRDDLQEEIRKTHEGNHLESWVRLLDDPDVMGGAR